MAGKNNLKAEELDRASQYREFCEKKEQKARHLRNRLIVLSLFLFMVIGAAKMIFNFFSGNDGNAVLSFIVSFIGYIALISGIGILFWLVSAVNESIWAARRVSKARKLEGSIAQNIFHLMISNPNH